MFRYLTYAALLFCGSFFSSTGHAQEFASSAKMTSALSSSAFLPMLLDSAVKYSPQVQRIETGISLAEENLKQVKKNIYNAVSAGASYNYGNTGNLTSGQLSAFTMTRTNYYNAGIGINLPISLLLTRKSTIRAGELQVKMVASEKEDAAQHIRQEVIRLFQELKLAHKLVQVSSETKQSAVLNAKMAEKQFVQGDVSIADLSRVQELSSKAVQEFESTVNRLQTAYLQLENYVGFPLSTLIASF